MKLVLVTLHSRYSHSSLALPSLAAACSGIVGLTTIVREWTIHENHERLLRRLVAEEADVYGFSCYVWNIGQILRLVAELKVVRPHVTIVLGGPEVSYGTFELMARESAIDCVVRGEGEECFRELAVMMAASNRLPPRDILATLPGITFRSDDEIVANPGRPLISQLDSFPSPFLAGLVDVSKPLVYLETSRGCPYSCAFCLSSLDRSVRSYSSSRIKDDLSTLLGWNVATVKLVDRTFNYDPQRATDIWEYILKSNHSASRFHFEIAAELLTEDNFRVLRMVPKGMFRFEIGIQSDDPAVLKRVGRPSDIERLMAVVRRLLDETEIIVHLDLVAGLPGEGYDRFLGSLERLLKVRPHHIQVEPLKVLKGTPMRRIAAEEGYQYATLPPYKIFSTPDLSFEDICRIEDVSRLLDLIVNAGRFSAMLQTLADLGPLSIFLDRFACFVVTTEESDPKSFIDLCDLIQRYLSLEYDGMPLLSDALSFDYCRAEYPSKKRLPICFGSECGIREPRGPDRGSKDELSGVRIRRFRRQFLCNYLTDVCQKDLPVEIFFTYVARQGEGEKVFVEAIDGERQAVYQT